MFSILDKYTSRIVLNFILVILFLLISLSSIIKFIEQLRKIGLNNYSIMSACFITLLTIPKGIEAFFSISILLGSLLGIGYLVFYNELVIMQVSGFSRLQIIHSIMKVIIFLSFLVIFVDEWIVPLCERVSYTYINQLNHKRFSTLLCEKLWLKDDNDFVFIKKVVKGNELSEVNIYSFDEEEKLKSIKYIKTAFFKNGMWVLHGIHELNLTTNYIISNRNKLDDIWRTSLTPKILNIISVNSNELSILDLFQYIKYLNQNHQKSSRYQLNLWNRIFLPFSMMSMVFLALSFVFNSVNYISVRNKILIGLIIGFFFHILDQIIRSISLSYDVPSVFVVIFSNSLGFFIGTFILLKY